MYKWLWTTLCFGRSTISGLKRRRHGGRLCCLVLSWTGAIVCVCFFVCDGPTHHAPPLVLPPSLLLTRPMRVPTPPPHPPSGQLYTDARAPTHKPCLNRWDGHVHMHNFIYMMPPAVWKSTVTVSCCKQRTWSISVLLFNVSLLFHVKVTKSNVNKLY